MFNTERALATVIMAAGKGTRMKSVERAKVMFELNGKPMLHYVADVANEIGSVKVIAIVGFQHEGVVKYLERTHPNVEFTVQEPQLGTGHAVMQVESALLEFSGNVLVLSGDVPLLKGETLKGLLSVHLATDAVATVLTAELDDPFGYGRVIRNSEGLVEKIVEQKDASPQEQSVREINSGIYLFKREALFAGLRHINAHNVQKEYYLTDVFEYFGSQQWSVAAVKVKSVDEILGINTYEQLEEAERILIARGQASTG